MFVWNYCLILISPLFGKIIIGVLKDTNKERIKLITRSGANRYIQEILVIDYLFIRGYKL